jgi:hypothetical protein
MARNEHLHAVEAKRGSLGGAKNFHTMKLTLTACRDEAKVTQKNRTNFIAQNRHSQAAKIGHRSGGRSAKSNRFHGTKSILTSCGDRAEVGAKSIGFHGTKSTLLTSCRDKAEVTQYNPTNLIARNRPSLPVETKGSSLSKINQIS